MSCVLPQTKQINKQISRPTGEIENGSAKTVQSNMEPVEALLSLSRISSNTSRARSSRVLFFHRRRRHQGRRSRTPELGVVVHHFDFR